VPSSEILLTGSLPSGHPLAKLCIEKSDKAKIRRNSVLRKVIKLKSEVVSS